MLTCATGAWAGYASGTVNIITSDTDGTAADGYKYEDVTIGDSATYPSDLELGYGNTSNPPKLNKSYIYLFNATGDTNGSNKNTTLNLGNGFTATVTLPSDDNGTTTLKITGTPNKTGKVSFRVGRFDSTSPSNNTAAKGVSTLIITVKNAPSTKAPTITKKTNPSEATHGKKFYFTIEASNNVDPSEESTTGYSNVTIYDDEDKTNGVLSAAELKALFEITATNSGDGTLILEADKLQAPTSVDITGGIKFIAQVSNDYTYGVTSNNEQAAEDGIEEDYVVTQTYTLKINPIAPKIKAVYVDGKKFTKTDFGMYPVSGENKISIWFETNATTANIDTSSSKEGEEGEEGETDSTAAYILSFAGLPDGLSIVVSADGTKVSDDLVVPITKFVYGITGTPDKAGTFKSIKVTPSNTAYNSTGTAKTYSMTILDKPSMTVPAEGKELTVFTFDHTKKSPTYSSTVKFGGGDASSHPVTILSGDTDASTIPSFLTFTKTSGKNEGTIDLLSSFKNKTLTSAQADILKAAYAAAKELEEAPVDGFGDNAAISFDIKFELSCDLFDDTVIESRTITFKTIKPVITAAEGLPTISIASNTDLDDGLTLTATAAGNITWTYDKLPSGVKLVDAEENEATDKKLVTEKSGLDSVVTITGKPTEPAKSFVSTFTATNGAGSNTYKVTFNVQAPTPVIGYYTDDGSGEYATEFSDDDKATPFSGDFVVGNPFTSIMLKNKAVGAGATTFTVKGLPSGLTAKMSGDREMLISGTFKAATKSAATIDIIASENKDTPTAVSTAAKFTGVNVYAKPKITTSRLADLTVGKFDTVTIAADGVQTWYIGSSTDPTKTDGAIKIDDKKDSDLHYTFLTSADTVPNSKGAIELKLSRTITTIPSETTQTITGYGLTFSGSGTSATIGKGASALHKGIKVTVSADNGLGAATKTFTVVVDGIAPKWLTSKDVDVTGKTLGTGKGTAAYEKNLLTYNVDKDSAEIITLTVSGDKPLEISYGTLPDGISLTITSTDDELPKVKIVYTADNNNDKKPGNKKIAFTAKNMLTGKNAKVSVQLTAQQKPNISNTDVLTKGKEVESGKKLSLKAVLKPADKTATWAIVSADLPFKSNTIITSAAEIKAKFGITIDSKGTIGGTTTNVTSVDGGGADFMKLRIWVSNDAGEDFADAYVKIKGGKPKLDNDSKTFTFTRDVPLVDANVSADKRTIMLQGNVPSDDVKMEVEGDNQTKLTNLGLEISPHGEITGTPAVGTKNTSITISTDYFGNRANLRVKFVVEDPVALLSPDTGLTVPITFANVALNEKGKTEEVDPIEDIRLVLDKEATDVPTWKIAKKPDSRVKLTITAKDTSSVTLKATLKKGFVPPKDKSGDIIPINTSFVITATNKSTKKVSTSAPISIDVTFAATESEKIDEELTSENSDVKEANKKEDELVEEELTKELGEGDLSIGAERTESALTDEQKAAIKAEGYMIAAILPEISATADGQYGLEVDLLADVPAGSELKWLAYPQSPAEPSTDDEIADFFDIDGADTTTVPSDHIVLVYPWLREGVKYAPVIVAKVSEAAPGDVVSEEGLDEAVENAKEGAESTEEIVLDGEGKTTEEDSAKPAETPAEETANNEAQSE